MEHKTDQPCILLVDDDPHICEALSRILENEGFPTVSANNGVEGLQMMAENEVDLVLTDLDMPELNGLNFARHIRSSHSQIPVILFSGTVPLKVQESLCSFEEFGINVHMQKPISKESLLKVVNFYHSLN